MTAPGRRVVEKRAHVLLEQMGITEPPVDVDKVARGLGYKVVFKYFDDDELSGTVFTDVGGSITLGINTFHAPVRQRFSIAHEIGHAQMHIAGKQANDELFVDPPARTLFRDGKASLGEYKQEIEANQFAAALLMPADFVSRLGSHLVKTNPSISVAEIVESLARGFEVSTQAMKYRLVTLGVIEPD
jgi:Zn-dependent peptidase ImmA (M78 family)